jgi:hypothetical protein
MTKLSLAAAVGAVALAAAASNAFAEPTPPVPAVAPASQAAPPPNAEKVAQGKSRPKTRDSDRIVCQTEETTGSRLGSHRTCKTKAEWEQESQDSAAQFRAYDERDNSVNPSGH